MTYPDFPRERATLDRVLQDYIPEHEGEYIVIAGADVLGTAARLEDALALGFEHTGGANFFTERIRRDGSAEFLPAAVVWTS